VAVAVAVTVGVLVRVRVGDGVTAAPVLSGVPEVVDNEPDEDEDVATAVAVLAGDSASTGATANGVIVRAIAVRNVRRQYRARRRLDRLMKRTR
jgi:hypothetical protein